MKIITLHTPIETDELSEHLRSRLNPLFNQQRQTAIDFKIEQQGNTIKILQPGLYEGALFELKVKGAQLWITRNEHYVDDVNSLTLESILNSLFEDLSDDPRGVDLITEG